MRLLELDSSGEPRLTEFIGNQIPPYAILSHTWGADGEEITFKDIMKRRGKDKTGYRKIQFCGRQAAKDGLYFFWVDTCCIDKSSSAELSEAVNSMFRWYRDAAKCYVYLADVSIASSMENDTFLQQTWNSAFQHSRWFTRGWTLQELLAPTSVDFFSVEGKRLGDKISLLQAIHKITGISAQALQGDPLFHFSVEERMSWVATRNTTREEDLAYSLLGIFDISMPLIYGEGWKKSLIRLQKKINKSLKDEVPMLPLILSSKFQEPSLEALSNSRIDGSGVIHVEARTPSLEINKISAPRSDDITWHGQYRYKPGQDKNLPYFRERNKLSNANYSGDWEEVITLLETRKVNHGEIWANCWRIKGMMGSPSGFTALHQAAWYGAPRNIVQKLLQLGAWKLARTLKPSENSRTRSTPYEIAKDRGQAHLYDLLYPVIRRPVDHRALQALQQKMNALIREKFPKGLLRDIILPDLEVLTEFENSGLWFPLDPEIPNVQGRSAVHIVLDRDELVVMICEGEERKSYHVSTFMVQELDEASK